MSNHSKNDNERALLIFKIGRILLWVGGFYGIMMGLYVAFGPTGEYATSTGYHGYTTTLETEGILFAFIIAIIPLLLFGGCVIFLTKHRLRIVIGLLAVQVILEALSLPGFGILFIPATLLLIVATVLIWLSQHLAGRRSLKNSLD